MSALDVKNTTILDGKTQEILQQFTLLILGLMTFIFVTIIITLIQINRGQFGYRKLLYVKVVLTFLL